MLKTLLAMFSTLELGNRLQYDLLVHHILDSRINEAVAWAIFKREITILKVLVNAMNKGATTHPERKDFNKWLTAAIRTQSVDFVKTVLSVNINSRAKVSQGMFVTACNQGVPEIITALFGKNQIDPNKKFLECTPLILATRTGNLDVMKAVLDAGADINGSISEWPCNALEQAVHIRKAPSMEKREAAAKLLLSRGADVSATRSWPATKGLFNIFREAHLSRGAENVPTFEDYRSMEKARMMSFGEVIARLIL
ncbi:hypothetical protein CC80DRAFT_490822 [Byssothecium circinans]|uniref:Uncharacterized protein n=1 Tax=Byssothecium circinans TaxID=147558 RepID=A0A6A5U0S4_9PLEO|nr:hypothetical protein CC80DRAFT_490822 [Byssothecium circinans]